MRVALFSCVHGNSVALDAVLADLADQHPDLVVCLGDVAASGPRPRQVIERLAALDCLLINGNADDVVLGLRPLPPFRGESLENIRWGMEQLTEGDRSFLRSFRATAEVELGDGASLLCFHGSPRSNMERLLPTTPNEDLSSMLGDVSAAVAAGGHTHVQMVRLHGGLLLLNAGTVGYSRPDSAGDYVAEYAMVGHANGALAVELRRVPFDGATALQSALDAGMPHAHWWADQLARPRADRAADRP
jgi:predicted phosphodiesterase